MRWSFLARPTRWFAGPLLVVAAAPAHAQPTIITKDFEAPFEREAALDDAGFMVFAAPRLVQPVDAARSVLVRQDAEVLREDMQVPMQLMTGRRPTGLPEDVARPVPDGTVYARVLNPEGEWACAPLPRASPLPQGEPDDQPPLLCLHDRDGDGAYDRALADTRSFPIEPMRLAPVSWENSAGRGASRFTRRIRVERVTSDSLVLVAEMRVRPAGALGMMGIILPGDDPALSSRTIPLRAGASIAWNGLAIRLDGSARAGWWLSARGAYPAATPLRQDTRLIVGGTVLELDGHLPGHPIQKRPPGAH